MNESTISSAEMSISTPCALAGRSACQIVLQRHRQAVVHVHLDRDQQVIAHLQDRNAFHALSPVAVGRGPAPVCPCFSAPREAAALQRDRERVRQRRLGDHVVQLDAEVDDRLGDLRADAADDAVGAHQPRGGDGLEQVLRGERVDRRHAGDVDDGDRRAGVDDPLQQALHHDLRAGAVQRADQRQGQDALPQLDHRRGQLEHLLLLPHDHLLAGPLIRPRS